MAGPFAISTDEHGIVGVVATGFWSPADLQGHFGELKKAIDAARARIGIARVLVDLRASSVQSKDIFERCGEATSAIYDAEDRIAIVAESTLLTMQMRRLDAAAGRAAFTDPAEARGWLLSA